MALTDIPTAARAMNLTGSGWETWLSALVPAACKVVENYCKRNLETQTYTDYFSGNGMQELPLRQRPVVIQTLTGTLNSTTAVSALSSTTLLAAGMAVSGTGIPSQTTIASVDSATAITLSAAATASGSTSLTFGPSVWLDAAGFYGKGTSAFAASTLLREGSDYVLRYDPDGAAGSRSALLIRLGGGITGTTMDAVWPWDWRKGSLSLRFPPVWPAGIGNIKAVYAAGHGVGPKESGGTLPEDLTMAANQIVAWLRRMLPLGVPVASEHLGQYSYTVLTQMLNSLPELGSTRQILGRYREVSL